MSTADYSRSADYQLLWGLIEQVEDEYEIVCTPEREALNRLAYAAFTREAVSPLSGTAA